MGVLQGTGRHGMLWLTSRRTANRLGAVGALQVDRLRAVGVLQVAGRARRTAGRLDELGGLHAGRLAMSGFF